MILMSSSLVQVQGSLGMNVVSAIFSASGIGLLITDFFITYNCFGGEDCYRLEVPIVTYPKQATPGNPQHVMYIPQSTLNTNNFVQPNLNYNQSDHMTSRPPFLTHLCIHSCSWALNRFSQLGIPGVVGAVERITDRISQIKDGHRSDSADQRGNQLHTIVTQVIPSSTSATTDHQTSSQTITPLKRFLKGEPKALGHITAGCLTVSANNKLNPCTVKGALVMNIFSTIAAGTSIIILSLDLVIGNIPEYCSYDYIDYRCRSNVISQSRNRGIVGVLLVFSLLQLCISIAVSVFTCKATCTSEPTLNIINVVPNPERCPPVVSSFSSSSQAQLGVNMMHAVAMGGPPDENPPAYCEKSQPDY
ncbi:Membrane-spanning 4-domains subfamily A member 12 [Bagarius yarrelli]|uniref:Membrane-spanning 4-domains subfamily A member 12 n=1 Tax=Bagarius yarrelli TaxID=175774 RepID=A0A556VBV6_BAGYA|nr:Membrane-spanning 4-domains subfamily A member 12 [Bagarius yarrelli]